MGQTIADIYRFSAEQPFSQFKHRALSALRQLVDFDSAYEFDQRIETLTPAETVVAKLLLQGCTNKQIADVLQRSPKTIEHQMASLCHKLVLSNRTEVIWYLKKSNYRLMNG